jgi:hypothetical protein
MEAATQSTNQKPHIPDALDKIVIGMAAVAPELDAMGQEEKLKTFELFGAMVDAALSERAKA